MTVIVQRPIAMDPVEIADETFLIRHTLAAPDDPVLMYQSSMVIRGSEPILVDTGPASASDQWLAAVFGLVDPADVRWICVSHNDSDHNGNLLASLAACPNATLVTTSGAVARMTSSFDLPYRRMQWRAFGDTFDAGDRTIEIVDPPVYDSPITQGFFDRSTGVYWAVDAFAATVSAKEPAAFADEADAAEWEHALTGLGIVANPWLEGARTEWFDRRLAAMTALDPTAVASAHAPTLRGASIRRACDIYRGLPGTTPPTGPDQRALEAQLARIH